MQPPRPDFHLHPTADGRAFIFWRGRQVAVLTGKKAARVLAQWPTLDPQGQQLLLARVTGNFKRGNER